MQILKIQNELSRLGKKVTSKTIYRYFKKLGIKPQGARQRPQKYPADTALRLAHYLGLELTPPTTPRPAGRPWRTTDGNSVEVVTKAPAKIITLKQIKAGGAR